MTKDKMMFAIYSQFGRRMTRSLLLAACGLALAVSARGAAPVVTFEGSAVKVERMTVSAIPFNRYWPGRQRPKSQTKTAYFAAFDTDRGGRLTVDGVTRVIDGVGTYTFEVDGGTTELHVFADPPWKYEKTVNEIYFGPGEHFPEVIAPEDGQTVVLDRGAVVHGTIFIHRKRGVRIVGRGILDLSGLKRADRESKIYRYVESLGLPPNEMSDKESDPGMSCTALVAYGARDLVIEGITVRDAPRWTMQIRNGCRGVTIDNVKILGSWRYNNDGIDLCTASEVNVRNCFVRTYDDAFVVRAPFLTGEREGCRDILVEDCVTWNDWGCTTGIAHQYRSCTIEGVTFRRLRVERPSACVATVHVTMGHTNCVTRDVLYEDITVHNFPGRWKQALQLTDDQPFAKVRPESLDLLTVGSRKLGRWVENQKIVDDRPADWYGFDFDNIVFRNIRVLGDWAEPCASFFTRVPRHTVRNLLVEGCPANMKVQERGNVERLAVPAADRNAYALAGVGKIAFRLDLGRPCFPTPVRTVRARDMRAFAATTNAAGVVTLVWKGHPLCGADFTVTGTCTPKAGGYAYALETAGNASRYDLQGVAFPLTGF